MDLNNLLKNIDNFKYFTGGPKNIFMEVAFASFYSLTMLGMSPKSKLLDIGCGALRNGIFLINYLDTNNYFGIEPNNIMLEEGIDKLGKTILENKNPMFSNNEDFQFSSEFPNNLFDLIFARSIFTHTSISMMDKCFYEISKVVGKDSKILLSYVEPNNGEEEYSGDTWVGLSHKSSVKGMAKFKKNTILSIAKKYNFTEENNDKLLTFNQKWLVLKIN